MNIINNKDSLSILFEKKNKLIQDLYKYYYTKKLNYKDLYNILTMLKEVDERILELSNYNFIKDQKQR